MTKHERYAAKAAKLALALAQLSDQTWELSDQEAKDAAVRLERASHLADDAGRLLNGEAPTHGPRG